MQSMQSAFDRSVTSCNTNDSDFNRISPNYSFASKSSNERKCNKTYSNVNRGFITTNNSEKEYVKNQDAFKSKKSTRVNVIDLKLLDSEISCKKASEFMDNLKCLRKKLNKDCERIEKANVGKELLPNDSFNKCPIPNASSCSKSLSASISSSELYLQPMKPPPVLPSVPSNLLVGTTESCAPPPDSRLPVPNLCASSPDPCALPPKPRTEKPCRLSKKQRTPSPQSCVPPPQPCAPPPQPCAAPPQPCASPPQSCAPPQQPCAPPPQPCAPPPQPCATPSQPCKPPTKLCTQPPKPCTQPPKPCTLPSNSCTLPSSSCAPPSNTCTPSPKPCTPSPKPCTSPANLCTPPEPPLGDILCVQVKKLTTQKFALESKLKDLEMKVDYLKETLEKGEERWKTIECECEKKLGVFRAEIKLTQDRIDVGAHKIEKFNDCKPGVDELESLLKCLEKDRTYYINKIAETDLQKKHSCGEQKRLSKELGQVFEELHHLKNCVEPELRAAIKKNLQIINDLKQKLCKLEKEKKQTTRKTNEEASAQTGSLKLSSPTKVTYPIESPYPIESSSPIRSPTGRRSLSSSPPEQSVPDTTPKTDVSPADNNEKYSKPVDHRKLSEKLRRHSKQSTASTDSSNDEYHSATDLSDEDKSPTISAPHSEPELARKSSSGFEPQSEPQSESLLQPQSKSSSKVSFSEPLTESPNESPDDKVKVKTPQVIDDDPDLLKPTISSLLSTVQTLQCKLSSKDQLIQCLADQVIGLADSGCCWTNSLLDCIAAYPFKRRVDFDCAMLADYLSGFVYFRPDVSEDQKSVHKLDLQIVGATTFDSLLLSWKVPPDLNVGGFDIYVNDELVERIRDSEARKTLLHPVDLQNQNLITVCALDMCGIHFVCDVICVPPVSIPIKKMKMRDLSDCYKYLSKARLVCEDGQLKVAPDIKQCFQGRGVADQSGEESIKIPCIVTKSDTSDIPSSSKPASSLEKTPEENRDKIPSTKGGSGSSGGSKVTSYSSAGVKTPDESREEISISTKEGSQMVDEDGSKISSDTSVEVQQKRIQKRKCPSPGEK